MSFLSSFTQSSALLIPCYSSFYLFTSFPHFCSRRSPKYLHSFCLAFKFPDLSFFPFIYLVIFCNSFGYSSSMLSSCLISYILVALSFFVFSLPPTFSASSFPSSFSRLCAPVTPLICHLYFVFYFRHLRRRCPQFFYLTLSILRVAISFLIHSLMCFCNFLDLSSLFCLLFSSLMSSMSTFFFSFLHSQRRHFLIYSLTDVLL